MTDCANRGSINCNASDAKGRLGAFFRRRGSGESALPVPMLSGSAYLQRVHDLRHLLSGEWVWDVLTALVDGPQKYTDLLNSVRARQEDTGWPGKKHMYLRDGPLNKTLRRLEQGELVKRNQGDSFPYHTAYELTPAAQKLLVSVVPMVEWAESHADLLNRARQRRHTGETEDG